MLHGRTACAVSDARILVTKSADRFHRSASAEVLIDARFGIWVSRQGLLRKVHSAYGLPPAVISLIRLRLSAIKRNDIGPMTITAL